MNAAQIQDLIVQNSKGMPVDLLEEVLDFIRFLKLKKTGGRDTIELSLREFESNEASHLEDEMKDYKLMYPHE